MTALLMVLGTVTTGPAQASPAQGKSDTRTVTYQGYRLKVPATWHVVDLAEQPDACIRFDHPAVYLGHPGDSSACPTGLVGRTQGLIVEPLATLDAGRTTSSTARAAEGSAVAPRPLTRNGEIQVAIESAGVLVTAAHTDATEASVRKVLGTATLTADAHPVALATARVGAAGVAAAAGPQPGDFTGKGFDACAAPSQSTMDSWLANSPYRAVGVYISGQTRACGQPNLTASWVSNQTAKGWHLIPIEVGRQAPCSAFSNKMSSDPATARSQGASAANSSVSAAQSLGIPAGSAIYNDIEGYASNASCKAAVLSYLSGWTEALHASGYLSGVYSSASSGIRDAAAEYNNPAYTRVDHIWFAWWNNAADTNTGSYAPASAWPDHQRIHQYAGEVSETWGGATVNIDRNYLDVGLGSPQASRYWVDTYADAPVFASATSTTETGTLRKGTNYVYCKVWGRMIGNATSYNHWWLRTDPDVGPANQYVSAYYLSRWGNDEAKDNSGNVIPDC
ncbi:glycoside hydrolase domain-containing protein [Streptomyces sp. NPDC055749]